MKPIKTILRRSISLLLAAAVVLPGAMPSCAFAANEQSSQSSRCWQASPHRMTF